MLAARGPVAFIEFSCSGLLLWFRGGIGSSADLAVVFLLKENALFILARSPALLYSLF